MLLEQQRGFDGKTWDFTESKEKVGAHAQERGDPEMKSFRDTEQPLLVSPSAHLHIPPHFPEGQTEAQRYHITCPKVQCST